MLRGLAHADVADRRRHQHSLRALQRAQHDLDRKLAAVLAPRGELDPGADLLRQRVLRESQIVRDQPFREALRNDVRHLLPEELVAAVAELLLGLEIQQDDLAALVHHHHGVRRRFQQAAVAALHLRQMLLRTLAHADVADRRRHQRSLGAFQRAQHDLDRKLAAVLAPPGELDPGADLLRQRVLRGSQIVRDQPFRETLRNDVRHLLPEQLVAAVAELLLGLEVQQDDLAALVHHHHRVRRRFQQPAVAALHLRQMLFRGLAHADVADRRRHQRSLRALQRAQHDLDRKLAAVLAPSGELDPGADLLRRLAFRESKVVRDQPFREALRDDVRYLLPDEFVAVVAELLLRLQIQQDDLAALVHHHHGVRRRFQQPAVAALHLRQMLFRGLAHADVADRRRHQDSLRALQRAQHDLDRKLAAVLAPSGELDPAADLLRQRVFRGSKIVRDQPLRETLRDDVRHLLPDELIAVVAELLLGLKIQQHDLAALVHHHHRIRSRLQQPAILRARLLAFAEIATDARKPPQISGRVVQGREDDTRQELRAVFPHAHAVFFQPAAGSGQPEYLLRPAPRDIVRRIKTGKISADDLVGAVTLDLFGPGVPSDNLALRVHHDDRMVPHFVEEHPISLLAVLQRLLGMPAPRTVAPDAPACGGGDQQAQDGSEDQSSLGLVKALRRICFA